ncbi:response regulator receiver modulated translation initiation factor IF-2 [Kalymmatonema gypsitolerans NIES-4073]|nr:response regulator receiver modulated translation initiation factor IF-2 [Scytonema sp. NIES-4073]
MPTTNKEREMRIAQRRVEGFARQFGEAHRNLARHAAFPLVLTADLLYQIWANFVPEAPWTTVAHVLLSRLCRQVGYEMYEMDIGDRNLLLRELKGKFGQERFDELGEFLLDYVAQRLTDDDADTQDLREAQEWTALAYTKPDEAARELAQALSQRVQQEDMGEVLRLASLVETLAQPLIEAGFEPLLVYSLATKSFIFDTLEDAVEQFEEILDEESQLWVAGISLSVPKQIISQILESKEPVSYHQASADELRRIKQAIEIMGWEEVDKRYSEFEKNVYNIVVIGKTGAGKSSLINYLYGGTIAQTGVGKPVIKKGFQRYNLTWESIPINIYEFWGLEVGQAPERLHDELKEHGIDRPVSEWFHTIYYCINAASARIEPFEFNIIQDLMTNKYRVIVVLTRAELMSGDSLSRLKNWIRKEVSSEIPIIEVCSVVETTRIGKTHTFGKYELQNETLRGFWNAITVRLPERCEFVLHKEVDKWCEEQKQYLNSMHRFNKSEIKETIENNYNDFFKNLKETRYEIVIGEVKKIVSYYKQLTTILEYPPPEDFPEFTLENKKLISNSFIEEIAVLVEEAQQSDLRTIGRLIDDLLPDTRPELLLKINEFGQELKDEISKQKPELSQIIEKIRRNTP